MVNLTPEVQIIKENLEKARLFILKTFKEDLR